jgi:dihydrofolate reductase
MILPERWHEIDRLFDEALDVEPDVRAAFLDQRCPPDLRASVDALLEGASESDQLAPGAGLLGALAEAFLVELERGEPVAGVTSPARGELAMRKVLLFVSVSLDGFFEGPNKEIDWHMVDDEFLAHVDEVLKEARGDLVVGGGDLGAEFMRQDLIDEYRIFVHPVQIGEGKRLFPTSNETVRLRLAETRTFGNGVVLLRYERLRPGEGS